MEMSTDQVYESEVVLIQWQIYIYLLIFLFLKGEIQNLGQNWMLLQSIVRFIPYWSVDPSTIH